MTLTVSTDLQATETIDWGTGARLMGTLKAFSDTHGLSYDFDQDAEGEDISCGNLYRDGIPVGFWSTV